MTVTLVHLFPRELGAAGDAGNVVSLAYRLRERGVPVQVVECGPGDKLPATADAVVIGTGPWSAATRVFDTLQGYAKKLAAWVADGVPVLAVGTGAELLGREIRLSNGDVVAGLGIFPLTVRRDANRLVGYTKSTATFGDLVGFADLSSVWELPDGATPLGAATIGPKELHQPDGVVVGSCFATQMGGPVLPLNPDFADLIVSRILERSGQGQDLSPLDLDDDARRAREVILDNFGQVFTTISL